MTTSADTTPRKLPPSPARRRRARQLRLLTLRLVWGLGLLGLLAYTLWEPGRWPLKLGAWVLLTLLADEAGGWFGYAGVALGSLPWLVTQAAVQTATQPAVQSAAQALPGQWYVITPLIGGALLAALVVKHSGGPLVIPFAGVLFALPVLLTWRLVPSLDSTLSLPGNHTFLKVSLGMAALGLGFSFLRQVVGVLLRWRQERPETLTPPQP